MPLPHNKCSRSEAQTGFLLLFYAIQIFSKSKDSITSCDLPDIQDTLLHLIDHQQPTGAPQAEADLDYRGRRSRPGAGCAVHVLDARHESEPGSEWGYRHHPRRDVRIVHQQQTDRATDLRGVVIGAVVHRLEDRHAGYGVLKCYIRNCYMICHAK